MVIDPEWSYLSRNRPKFIEVKEPPNFIPINETSTGNQTAAEEPRKRALRVTLDKKQYAKHEKIVAENKEREKREEREARWN